MTTVTRDDIDGALINVMSNAMNYPDPLQMLGKDTGPLRKKCVDAMCDLLGIDAEQSADPVEAKAQELWEVAKPSANATWSGTNELAKEQFRKVAAHVLGQEEGDE